MALSGNERQTTAVFTAVLAFTVFLESTRSLSIFLVLVCPLTSLCFSMMHLSVQSLVTHVAPTRSIFSVLAAIDVLQNAVSISVPFYRTVLFRYLKPAADRLNLNQDVAVMQGDPDPVYWIYSSAFHWFLAAIAIAYLLLSNEDWWRQEQLPNSDQPAKKRKGK